MLNTFNNVEDALRWADDIKAKPFMLGDDSESVADLATIIRDLQKQLAEAAKPA